MEEKFRVEKDRNKSSVGRERMKEALVTVLLV